jgi:hypothetical protein
LLEAILTCQALAGLIGGTAAFSGAALSGSFAVITEIVTFDLPKGMTREQIVANFRDSIPRWRDNPDMIRKHMIFDLENGKAGGVYLWNSVADAKRWHDESFHARIAKLFGSVPSYQYFETPVVVDNEAGRVLDAAE